MCIFNGVLEDVGVTLPEEDKHDGHRILRKGARRWDDFVARRKVRLTELKKKRPADWHAWWEDDGLQHGAVSLAMAHPDLRARMQARYSITGCRARALGVELSPIDHLRVEMAMGRISDGQWERNVHRQVIRGFARALPRR